MIGTEFEEKAEFVCVADERGEIEGKGAVRPRDGVYHTLCDLTKKTGHTGHHRKVDNKAQITNKHGNIHDPIEPIVTVSRAVATPRVSIIIIHDAKYIIFVDISRILSTYSVSLQRYSVDKHDEQSGDIWSYNLASVS